MVPRRSSRVFRASEHKKNDESFGNVGAVVTRSFLDSTQPLDREPLPVSSSQLHGKQILNCCGATQPRANTAAAGIEQDEDQQHRTGGNLVPDSNCFVEVLMGYTSSSSSSFLFVQLPQGSNVAYINDATDVRDLPNISLLPR
jgi:hypothetical protein